MVELNVYTTTQCYISETIVYCTHDRTQTIGKPKKIELVFAECSRESQMCASLTEYAFDMLIQIKYFFKLSVLCCG